MGEPKQQVFKLKPEELVINMNIAGYKQVGKSCMISSFLTRNFDTTYLPTVLN